MRLEMTDCPVKWKLFDDMSRCTDAEVERMLLLASDQRREQALAYHHTFGQFACLKTYELLRQCVEEVLSGCESECAMMRSQLAQWDGGFVYAEHGKPFLRAKSGGERIEGVEISISHCKQAVGVALHDRPVGLDVESFRKASDSLLRRTMNADERERILHAENPDRMFSWLWTQKEAILKMDGSGLVDPLENVLSERDLARDCWMETGINEEKQYCWSLVYRVDERS